MSYESDIERRLRVAPALHEMQRNEAKKRARKPRSTKPGCRCQALYAAIKANNDAAIEKAKAGGFAGVVLGVRQRTRKPRAKAPSESTEARKFVAWLELNGYKDRFTHIPSGVDLSSMPPDVRYRVIAKLKSEGWRPGWPDYVIALKPRKSFDGGHLYVDETVKRSCFVELKKRGGKESDEQTAVIGMLPNAKVCVTADEAIAWVQKCEAT